MDEVTPKIQSLPIVAGIDLANTPDFTVIGEKIIQSEWKESNEDRQWW